ncbi:HNH endonuclease [Aliivibrio sp. S3MY1]|uniref:HNH nuclease domain-containing protein n=2 Tax=Aliivibrio TaxID=511678 RepID=A0A5Q4ZYS8_9GAMM|nr:MULTISPECIES: HNH endonuclease [Aliivibrio]MDD9175976.1 HNH endonuclease [Aliivibrio sp. S3TY1]MDD9193109.1 HNH endonuclease [Aliivibrio sp. S2TY2]MDD9195813.1 HNH endonuclease [Aliivibrio sp. S3MY1]RYU63808.1 HNH endonuclease [Aliivibrio finisterrensis]RYU82745.1 HNH endonuclease [Aliivibrio finisterrensis]
MTSTLFIGAIRNLSSVSRSDNPNFDEANKEFQLARESFVQNRKARMHNDEELECEKCTLAMPKGFHVHHKDGDHENNQESNFSIRCPFCHLCEHIGWVGKNRMGVIIFAPDISQENLNTLLLTTYCLELALSKTTDNTSEYDTLEQITLQARSIVRAFEHTKTKVLRNYQTNCPADFADTFLAMSEDEYQQREKNTFYGLRLFFHPDGFQKEIEMFSNSIFQINDARKSNPLHPAEWLSRATIFKNQKKGIER